jgi:hypothetical protein
VHPHERRNSERFSIEREVRYRILNTRSGDETGIGKTINISSSGVLFTSSHLPRPGQHVELSISWPVRLDDKASLKLVARGRVVRLDRGCVAMQIQQHEFRTQSSNPVPLNDQSD